MATTTAQLREKLAPDSPFLVVILLSEESNLVELAECIQENRRSSKEFWFISWVGGVGSRMNNSADLERFLSAVATHSPEGTEGLTIQLPFQTGDMGLVPSCLKTPLPRLNFLVLSQVNPYIDSTFEEVNAVLREVSSWEGLALLHFFPNLHPNPTFFQQDLVQILPKLTLRGLYIGFMKTKRPNDGIPLHDFAQKLENSFSVLQQDGLEYNYSLGVLDFGTPKDPSLQEAMSKLGEKKFDTLLKLNRVGRGEVISIPPFLEPWLEVVSRLDNHTAGDIDFTFYYLRRNPWMFHPYKGESRGSEVVLAETSKWTKQILEKVTREHENPQSLLHKMRRCFIELQRQGIA